MKTISARDANRHFSSLLREVATGEVITVLSRGKPVATIAPAQPASSKLTLARQQLFARLNTQVDFDPLSWSRGDLYEE